MAQNEPLKTDYVALGFEKIDRDLHFLIGCLEEVLISLGHEDLAALLPWTGKQLPCDLERLPSQTGLVFSIAFQLLNLVEENAAAQMRALRESELGVTAEPGLWGQALTNLGEVGFTGAEIASRLAFHPGRAGAHGASHRGQTALRSWISTARSTSSSRSASGPCSPLPIPSASRP